MAAAPADWEPLPEETPFPDHNPTTEAKVELGKKLYFDPRLSETGTVSCNTCHNVMEGGDDGRPTSMGVHGRIGPRNAPTVWNAAYNSSQFRDGRADSLEDQARGPLLAQPEMGMSSHGDVMERIRQVPDSPYDRYARGNEDALTQQQVRGLETFEQVGCATCHNGPAFNGPQRRCRSARVSSSSSPNSPITSTSIRTI